MAVVAERDRALAERDRVIADQARTLERVTAELRWHGLDDNALTVAVGFEKYKAARLGDACWALYKNLLAPLVARFGTEPCLQVTPQRWAEHRAKRKTEKCGRRLDRQPSTAQLDQELRLAKMLFTWLVRSGELPRNPLDLARTSGEPSERETWLEEADVQKLADGADVLLGRDKTDDDRRRPLLFRAWLLAMFGCGLRFDEARRLRADRIRPDGTIELSAKQTKGKRRRTNAFTDQALAAIRAIPVLSADPRIFLAHRRDGKLGLLSQTTLRKWFHVVCESTGVDSRAVDGERVVPHVLRHSAASHAEAAGAHPTDIQAMLGHASLATTERYLHRRPAQRALVMREIMSGRKPPQQAPVTEPAESS